MHYYIHNIGDYAISTRYMSWEQKGLYVDLVDHYLATGKPLASDWLAIIRRQASEGALDTVLALCFELRDGAYYSAECERMLADYAEMSERNRRNAGKRKTNQKVVQPATESHATGNPVGTLTTNQEPITNNQIEKRVEKKARASFRPRELDSGLIDPQAFADWLTVRKAKRAPLTETAWERLKAEAAKAGLGLNEVLVKCAEKGWTSFSASWESVKDMPVDPAAKAEADRVRFARIYGEVFGGKS